MQYVLVDGERQEAKPGLSGKCPNCSSRMMAKCGDIKMPHWAHYGVRNCDPWWENETEWHRAWKGHFPKEWQEFIQHAENGEKHIADVKTDQGYVIEFQRSPIKPDERQAREDFYKKMVWIVDGTRRSSDRSKFDDELEFKERVDGREDLRILPGHFGRCALLRDWGGRRVPVFFDFGEETLWGLLPKASEEKAYVFRVERNVLIASLNPLPQSNSGIDELLKTYTGTVVAYERYLQATAQQDRDQFLRLRPQYTSHSSRRRN